MTNQFKIKKPRITLFKLKNLVSYIYVCKGHTYTGYGDTPKEAYESWEVKNNYLLKLINSKGI